MRKICDEPVCFVVSLKEVEKYGLSPLEQLKENPEAERLFPKKAKVVKDKIVNRENKRKVENEKGTKSRKSD